MKKLFLSILFVMFMSISWAQTAPSVKGKVVDSKTLKPLHNAVATITTSNVSVVSDRNGEFQFSGLAEGSHFIELQTTGYVKQNLRVETKTGQTTDLGTIVMEEDLASEIQLSLITITENDLGDDNSGSESTSGLLQASRDTYQQVAAFNWGQARYRIRGLDNEYGNTMINGISMNKIYDGRPQWSNWGGLNDATRNQEFTSGSKASDYTFGSILGTQEINTRASHYRAGSRVSFSGANTNYNWRTMGTYASGLNKNGWAFVVSGSGRIADEAHFEGTDYKSWGLFAAVEKKFNDKHSLNFTSIASYNSRGKNSPLTQEQIDLMGHEYNSYWGWQNGKKRNSRDKDVFEPINMLTHYWTISNKTTLKTSLAYQTGHISNSRLDYQNAVNPDPVYYKNLPSYFLTLHDQTTGAWTPDYAGAEQAATYFRNNSQINWNSLYYANTNSSNGRSVYALYEDRTEDKVFSANSILASELSNNVTFNAAVNYKKLSSQNFQKLTDLLGGQYFVDTDMFYPGDAGQSDLNNPNRQVVEGDAYGYNYKLYADVIDAFTQFKVRYKKVDFYLSQQFSRSEYQREGLYRNGIYANNSYGKSKSQIFENFGFKGGINYRITGNHILEANGIYQTKAPTLRNTFANARLNNVITPDLESETIFGGDASYIVRTPKLKGRISGFYNKVTDATKIAFYYAENIGSDDSGDTDSFISEILTDVDKQNMGAELGLEYQITSTVKATLGAAYGQYTYSDNARVRYNDDAVAATGNPSINDLGKAYIKDYKQGGMPQQAYSFGLEYRAPQYWWIGANVNYLDDLYIDPSAILRTANFVTGSDGLGYEGMTTEDVRKVLKQEKLDSFTLVNLQGGKSWRVSKKNRNTVGFFASINNVFDVTYKTGGFEQSRKATYADLKQDLAHGVRAFGPKYFHGYGRTYFVNVYFNF